jgi:hypothetical protein
MDVGAVCGAGGVVCATWGTTEVSKAGNEGIA